MLLRFRVANYASLRDEQELSLVALDEHSDLAVTHVPDDDLQALPATAIYGANASGKSNLLQAFRFMADVVVDSHQRWHPGASIRRNAFRFDGESLQRPSEFSVDIVIDGVHYEYGFIVDDEAVRGEWLYSFTKQQRRVRRLLFERSGSDGSAIRFGEHLRGKKKAIADLVRPNSLYLSAAAANNHPLLSRLYQWFQREFIYIDAGEPWASLSYTLHELEEHDKEGVLSLLNYADFGLIDVHQEARPLDKDTRDKIIAFIRAVDPEHAPDDGVELHDAPRVEFIHRVESQNYKLPLELESSGTRGWFALLGPIIHALSFGKLVVVDELNAFLHPLLVGELVRLFQDPRFNEHGAQLVFNTHDVTLLSSLTPARLRRDQVWLTDRTAEGATVLRPLTEYRIRDGLDSVFRGYLVGRYRGVPVFDDSFLEWTFARHTRRHGSSAKQGSAEEAGEARGEEAFPHLLRG
ncbi:AAA family ATPase [Actinomadura bangladeshensis]|uniref:ATP-binding protein n=1 Tax=Actinomadura bangladeshensis TaxID=453573 RepID=A0A4R4N919_9ACTN|nr:ATP-binding protein [Actinomadura bangladeshensis]TDC05451.1 ATP-binding protein [Actinomadura bangladeshensis]